MKTFFALTTLVMATSVFASGLNLSSFTCSGSAENGTVTIDQVIVKNNNVSIAYSVNNQQVIQKYLLTEKNKNGTTDIHNQAYFIGATKSGDKNDFEDMALPHLGLYKNGLGSEIAFNINGNRVFGVVSCQ